MKDQSFKFRFAAFAKAAISKEGTAFFRAKAMGRKMNWKSWFQAEKKNKWILVLGIGGIFLIFLSTFLGSNDKKEQMAKRSNSQTIALSAEGYVTNLEKRLSELLSDMKDVGRVKLMITLESGSEYIYAQETKSRSSVTKNNEQETQTAEEENEYLLVDGADGKTALILTEIQPKIKGVVVICGGGKNASVRQTVVNAVTVALNIPSSRVFVYSIS